MKAILNRLNDLSFIASISRRLNHPTVLSESRIVIQATCPPLKRCIDLIEERQGIMTSSGFYLMFFIILQSSSGDEAVRDELQRAMKAFNDPHWIDSMCAPISEPGAYRDKAKDILVNLGTNFALVIELLKQVQPNTEYGEQLETGILVCSAFFIEALKKTEPFG